MAQRASSQVAGDGREFKALRDQQYFGSGVVECTAPVAETVGIFAKGGRRGREAGSRLDKCQV